MVRTLQQKIECKEYWGANLNLYLFYFSCAERKAQACQLLMFNFKIMLQN